jgi:Holliday junction resolvase
MSEQKTVAAPANTSVTGVSVVANNSTYRLPSDVTLQHAAKLSIVEDKPIMLDYWTDSLNNKVLIGVRENGEKLLVKSEDEYTSPIEKIYKIDSEYIIVTENSLYIVSASISTKRIS